MKCGREKGGGGIQRLHLRLHSHPPRACGGWGWGEARWQEEMTCVCARVCVLGGQCGWVWVGVGGLCVRFIAICFMQFCRDSFSPAAAKCQVQRYERGSMMMRTIMRNMRTQVSTGPPACDNWVNSCSDVYHATAACLPTPHPQPSQNKPAINRIS